MQKAYSMVEQLEDSMTSGISELKVRYGNKRSDVRIDENSSLHFRGPFCEVYVGVSN